MKTLMFLVACLAANTAKAQMPVVYGVGGYPYGLCVNRPLNVVGNTCDFGCVTGDITAGYSTFTLTFDYTYGGIGACAGYEVMVEGLVYNTTGGGGAGPWGWISAQSVAGGVVTLTPIQIQRTVAVSEITHYTISGPYVCLRLRTQGLGVCAATDRLSTYLTISQP